MSIRFVPVKIPVSLNDNGNVNYSDDIGRFDELLSKQSGALGFTVMPILDEDITPHQIYFSALGRVYKSYFEYYIINLGITSIPSLDIVLRHIRNLTIKSASLDRWNSKYTIIDTFTGIYKYLSENWSSIPNNVYTI